MRAREGLGRFFVAVSVVSIVSVSGGWALSAPKTPSPVRDSYELAAVRLPAEPPGQREQRATLLERQKTQPEETNEDRPSRHVLAAVEQAMPITARPGAGRTIGEMPAGSRFYGTPHKAWVLEQTPDGRFGRVAVPYSAERMTGWIRLAGIDLSRTAYSVHVDLSGHLITVQRFEETVMSMPAATGAAASPTPPGRYFVTDRAPFAPGGYLGSFAFGLSGIQPNLPAGWTGGDQLAIHGTNDPSSIGTSASAGCLRVSEDALARLKPVLRLGTPVIVQS